MKVQTTWVLVPFYVLIGIRILGKPPNLFCLLSSDLYNEGL